MTSACRASVRVPDQRADDEMVRLDPDRLELGQAIDVDQMPRLRQPHVHHRRKALAAGDDLGLVAPRCERCQRAGNGCRSLVGESRGLHCGHVRQQAVAARLVEEMQPLRDEPERHGLAFAMVAFLVDAHEDVAALDLEPEKAVGADRQHGIHRTRSAWACRA